MLSDTFLPVVNKTVFMHVSDLENDVNVANTWGLTLTVISIVTMAFAFVVFVKPSLWLVDGV